MSIISRLECIKFIEREIQFWDNTDEVPDLPKPLLKETVRHLRESIQKEQRPSVALVANWMRDLSRRMGKTSDAALVMDAADIIDGQRAYIEQLEKRLQRSEANKTRQHTQSL